MSIATSTISFNTGIYAYFCSQWGVHAFTPTQLLFSVLFFLGGGGGGGGHNTKPAGVWERGVGIFKFRFVTCQICFKEKDKI